MTLRLSILCIPCLALGMACNNNSNLKTPPSVVQPDSGMPAQNPTITVSGTAVVFPPALQTFGDGGGFYGTNGLFGAAPPSVVGRDLHIDEPLLVILGMPDARLADTTVGAGGAFSATDVPTTPVLVGMVATIVGGDSDGGFSACEDLGDAGLASGPDFCTAFGTSASTAYEGAHPSMDITGATAYGVPVAFEEFLSAKMGLAPGAHLIDQGFVIGYVIDANGKGVAGATLDTSANPIVPSMQYLDDNFNPLPAGTGASNSSGMFLVIAPGSPNDYPSPFSIMVGGTSAQATYGCHKLGSNTNSVFVLVYNAASPGGCT